MNEKKTLFYIMDKYMFIYEYDIISRKERLIRNIYNLLDNLLLHLQYIEIICINN